MAVVVPLHAGAPEPAVKTLIRVIETADGGMHVTASEGMDRSAVVGNLVLAAVHFAQDMTTLEGGD